MADKVFQIQDILPLGVKLYIPPFLGRNSQMFAEDVIRTQQIAGFRMHVERVINKIKKFLIWKGEIPLSLFGVVNQMWSVCLPLQCSRSTDFRIVCIIFFYQHLCSSRKFLNNSLKGLEIPWGWEFSKTKKLENNVYSFIGVFREMGVVTKKSLLWGRYMYGYFM